MDRLNLVDSRSAEASASPCNEAGESMMRFRTACIAAVATLFASGLPAVAGAAQDSTGWITHNALYNLVGCGVYSDWNTTHKIATSTEASPCPGQVQAGLKVGSTYVYGLWYGYQSQVVSATAGISHWSAYRN